MNRRFYKVDLPNTDYARSVGDRDEVAREKANLIGSKCMGSNLHAPVLDIDYEAQLLPSRTPGHYHLFLDKEIDWKTYRKVLLTLATAGLIQEGYCNASIANQQSFARYPSGGVPLERALAQRLDESQTRIRELEEQIDSLKELLRHALQYRDLLGRVR